jgi:hypothetical protein
MKRAMEVGADEPEPEVLGLTREDMSSRRLSASAQWRSSSSSPPPGAKSRRKRCQIAAKRSSWDGASFGSSIVGAASGTSATASDAAPWNSDESHPVSMVRVRRLRALTNGA